MNIILVPGIVGIQPEPTKFIVQKLMWGEFESFESVSSFPIHTIIGAGLDNEI